jgi:putative phosphoribosyl transferase
MIFNDRYDAGEKLADQLKEYSKNKESLLLAVPRGGVEVAFAVSRKLSLPIGITVARKIGAPFNPELAVAAVSEEGDIVVNSLVVKLYNVSQDYINSQAEKEKKEIEKRIKKYRKKPLVSFKDKKVIIIDDGAATGATIKVIAKMIKRKKPKELIVALPVACPETLKEIEEYCDKVLCLLAPPNFHSVGQFYHDFSQVTDQKVYQLLENESFN